MAHSARRCSHCKITPLHRTNQSGVCRPCLDSEKTPHRCTGCGGDLYRKAKGTLCQRCLTQPSLESTKFSGNDCEISKVVSENVRSPEDLIRVCQIDTNEWEIERFVCNKYEQASVPRTVGRSGKWERPSTTPIVTQLFQIKVWMRRKVALIAAREEVQSLIADAKLRIPSRPVVKRAPQGRHMLELSVPDLHVGKLAWSPETLYDHYDIKIAEQVYKDAIASLLARTAWFRFDKVVLVLGNDLLHSDTKAGTTTGGTVLDTDSRYHKSFGVARRLSTWAIDACREVAPVEGVIVPGNHDGLSAWHLGDSLECFYHNTDDVTISNEPSPRKYIHYGKNMLMFTHGDKGKKQNYPLLMATERPDIFGATTHREAHTGHLHTLQVQETMGVRVRISPALCPPDAWHSDNQFVGNERAAEAFVWHETEGIIAQATYTVPKVADAA